MTRESLDTFSCSAFAQPICYLIAGMLVLLCNGLAEFYWLKQSVSSTVALSSAIDEQPEGSVPVWIRGLPNEAIAVPDAMGEAVEDYMTQDTLNAIRLHERFIMVESDANLLEPLLASGRMPEAGQREILAGTLARQDSFDLNGDTFKVVGRLDERTGALGFSYVCFFDAELNEAHWDEGQRGWLHPNLGAYFDEFDQDATTLDFEQLIGAPIKTPFYLTAFGFLGLLLTAWGGHKIFIVFYTYLATRPIFLLKELGETILKEGPLFRTVHHSLYGLFFMFMLIAARNPMIGLRMNELVRAMFTNEDDLGYIGDAYASGNILLAAVATFYNNYVIQTLCFTLIISIVPFALGFFKTGLSLAMVGLAMAPIWAGGSIGYSYHCITMFLELESYILASFIAVFWARTCNRAILSPHGAWPTIKAGIRLYAAGILFTAGVLAIAALFEAITLITLQ